MKIKKFIKRIWWKLFREKAYYKQYAEDASASLRVYYEIVKENDLIEEYWRRRKIELMES